MKPEHRFVVVNDVRLRYLEWKGPKSATMVLLHGIGDNSHIWDHFSRSINGAVRIIAIDQRGHGESDWAVPPAYRFDDYVADLAGVVKILMLEHIVLMGHSMGALHATRFAAHYPDRVAGLIHADIEPCPPAWNKNYLTGLYNNLPVSYPTVDAYVDQMQNDSPYADRELLRRFASHALRQGDNGTFTCLCDREVFAHFDPRYDLRHCLRQINCPTLVVRGEESAVMPREAAENMCREIPKGRLTEVPRAKHPMHTDNPSAFEEAVRTFLEEIGFIGER